jgi:hypothetical protein
MHIYVMPAGSLCTGDLTCIVNDRRGWRLAVGEFADWNLTSVWFSPCLTLDLNRAR